jgi:CrcB protein
MDSSLASIGFVALGGSIGSTLRYLITKMIDAYLPLTVSVGTVCINIIGSFFAGALVGYWGGASAHIPSQARLLLLTGILGGFTTFSAFSIECVAVSRSENFIFTLFYISLHVIGSVVAAFCGMYLSNRLLN